MALTSNGDGHKVSQGHVVLSLKRPCQKDHGAKFESFCMNTSKYVCETQIPLAATKPIYMYMQDKDLIIPHSLFQKIIGVQVKLGWTNRLTNKANGCF